MLMQTLKLSKRNPIIISTFSLFAGEPLLPERRNIQDPLRVSSEPACSGVTFKFSTFLREAWKECHRAPQGLLFHCLENAQQCLYPSVNFRAGPRSYSSLCSSPSLTVCCDADEFHRAARVLGACPVRQLSPWLAQQAGWACPGRRQTGLPLWISVQCRPGDRGSRLVLSVSAL